MNATVIALEPGARLDLPAPDAVARAIARGDLVRKVCAARRTERALRDELRGAQFRVRWAELDLAQFDRAGRAPA